MKPTVSDAVATAIRTVLHDTGRQAQTITPSLLLATDLGLDSLDLAQAVVLLERTLGVDPFRDAASSRVTIRTVADLVAAYEGACNKS